MFWLVDANAVFAAMWRADPVLLAVVVATILLWNVSWGVALWNVLQGQNIDLPVHLAILVTAAGVFVDHVTPFGQAGGEPITAWILTQTAETDYEVSFASVASLDAINIVPSVTFAAVGACYVLTTETGAEELGRLPVAVLVIAVTVPAIAIVGWRRRKRIAGVVSATARRVTAVLPRVSAGRLEGVSERAVNFQAAVERLAVNRRRLAAALAFSALGWAFQAVGLWVTFIALESFIPLYVALFVLPLGRIGSVVPTPGGLGGTEAITVTLLAVLTNAGAATIAAAVTIHGVGGYMLTTTLGAAAMSTLGVRTSGAAAPPARLRGSDGDTADHGSHGGDDE